MRRLPPPQRNASSGYSLSSAVWRWSALLLACLFYLNSSSFRETVRQRVITELRQMTGGKVEVESFTWNLSTLHFEARNVTIHGREAAAEVPYAHADRIGVDVKIVSFFTRKISLENVAIDRFVLHLMIYPDGTTNQPPPSRALLQTKDHNRTCSTLR